MRAAVLQLPGTRTANQSRQVLRAAIRQLERAEIYFEAVAAMEVDDREARRTLNQLRADSAALRRHLGELRSALRE
jgi:hypothetical protein